MLSNIFKGKEPIFVAEIGLNHNGNIDEAIAMIKAAAECGADAVKFQTFIPELMVSPFASSMLNEEAFMKKDYDTINFFKKFTFSKEEWLRIQEAAKKYNVEFFSAAFDIPSVELLEELNVRLYKIASSEVTNIPLLEKIGRTKKPVIMSTGMACEEEILSAIETLSKNGTGDIVLLHCVSLYPLDDSEANLRRVLSLKEKFKLPVGLSDHSRDHYAAMIASAFGAVVIEKHFKLHSKHLCPDSEVSLEPESFSEMIALARRGFALAGSGEIKTQGRECNTARGARRSLFAAKKIPAGKELSMDDVIALRPGTGIPVQEIYKYRGKKVLTDIDEGLPLKGEYFEQEQ